MDGQPSINLYYCYLIMAIFILLGFSPLLYSSSKYKPEFRFNPPQPPAPSPQGTSTPNPFSSRHLNPQPLLLKAPQPPTPSPQGEGELRDAILSMCLLISCKTWSSWLNTCSFLNLITLIPNRPSYAVRFRSCSFVSSWS